MKNSKFAIFKNQIGFVLFLSCLFYKTASANDIINISQLNQSITYLDPKKFEDINVIEKTWSETFDGNRKFDLQFFGLFDKPDFAKQYWQLIPFYDDSEIVKLSQWESADCSITQAVIKVYDTKSIFIIASHRSLDNTKTEILPQNVAAKQLIKIFKLMWNLDQKPGLPRAYFLKIRELTTSDTACSLLEVDRILNQINP